MRNPDQRLLVFTAMVAAMVCAPLARAESRPRTITFQTRTMGTTAALTLVTRDSAAVADLAYDALINLHHTDSLLTNWTKTSEVARVNRLAGVQTVTLAPEINDVLTVAAEVGRASGGLFDVTVEPLVRVWGFLGGEPKVPAQDVIDRALAPVGWQQLQFDPQLATLRFKHPQTRIDLGGVAKGYGVDRVAALLRQAGVTNALIDLSGNMVALGDAAGKTGWTIGIMDPAGRHDYLGRLVLHDEAVATSGNYFQYVMDPGQPDSRRYGHILDPRTGWPAAGMASATVIAAEATSADAWATALIVATPDEARRLAKAHVELRVVLVEPVTAASQVIWVEEDLRADFVLRQDLPASITVRYF